MHHPGLNVSLFCHDNHVNQLKILRNGPEFEKRRHMHSPECPLFHTSNWSGSWLTTISYAPTHGKCWEDKEATSMAPSRIL